MAAENAAFSWRRLAVLCLVAPLAGACQEILELDQYALVSTHTPDAGNPEQETPSLLRCEDGDQRCNDQVPETCTDARWLPQAPCSLGCADGRCRECSGGARCRDGAVEVCRDGFWEFSSLCRAACEAGSCVDACTEGRPQCNGNVLQRCSAGAYVDEEPCPVACLAQEVEQRCGGECRPGELRCAPAADGTSANRAQSCTEQAVWGVPSPCGEAVCVAGLCSSCEPGALRCDGKGTGLEVCVEAGTEWASGEQCTGETPVCLPATRQCVACVPGEEVCEQGIVQRCTDTGSFASTGQCSTERLECGDCPIGAACSTDTDCRTGVCLVSGCAVCQPGTSECAGTVPRTCGSDGTWVEATPCTGETPVCSPDRGACTKPFGAPCVSPTECGSNSCVNGFCACGSATFQSLGVLAGDLVTTATGISADGAVVVGSSGGMSGSRAFRWTSASGMVPLGALPGTTSSLALGVSGDGAVVVGRTEDGAGVLRGFRWTQATGMEELPGVTEATAASSNGSVIVGVGAVDGANVAVRWVQSTGATEILFDSAAAYGTNADGSVVVGVEGGLGFRWINGSVTRLSAIQARGVSASGAVVVGLGSSGWRWTQATGTVSIGSLDNTGRSTPVAISGDGNVIVGTSPTQVPFRWTQGRGMVDLRTLFPTGVVPTGFIIQSANAASSNGSVLAGTGMTPSGQQEAWRATLGVECLQ